MNGLALCAGIGGLELGIRRALPGYRTVASLGNAVVPDQAELAFRTLWAGVESLTRV